MGGKLARRTVQNDRECGGKRTQLSHLNEAGYAHMVDVGGKAVTVPVSRLGLYAPCGQQCARAPYHGLYRGGVQRSMIRGRLRI